MYSRFSAGFASKQGAATLDFFTSNIWKENWYFEDMTSHSGWQVIAASWKRKMDTSLGVVSTDSQCVYIKTKWKLLPGAACWLPAPPQRRLGEMQRTYSAAHFNNKWPSVLLVLYTTAHYVIVYLWKQHANMCTPTCKKSTSGPQRNGHTHTNTCSR